MNLWRLVAIISVWHDNRLYMWVDKVVAVVMAVAWVVGLGCYIYVLVKNYGRGKCDQRKKLITAFVTLVIGAPVVLMGGLTLALPIVATIVIAVTGWLALYLMAGWVSRLNYRLSNKSKWWDNLISILKYG